MSDLDRKYTSGRHQLGINGGRKEAGIHKEHMIHYVDQMPKRGDTGPGKKVSGENGLHGRK